MSRETGRKLIAQNKRARYDYEIPDTWEAGMVLTGTEVKALRAGRATLTDGYAHVMDGEVWLEGVHIPEYTQGTWTNHAPRRRRKLLLNRREINKIVAGVSEPGWTLVPLALYFKDGKAKVEIGLARGKKSYDKRQAIAKREADREMRKAAAARLRRR
ncbi:SsrA-binding protein SmpB [Actinomadura parmotrematis]|uniref:SsrA-binding protein n=1 Tax=Actinomadura parmotrematis TaxID=2864039 RepID=A0ABS7G7F0_9ACTN|nr:SsrA-binding protein SmpB [Actinomadura parmotrematis]MBW8487553.1 SsrA-binding protein SmpB [Actinomadura parmotrematis]